MNLTEHRGKKTNTLPFPLERHAEPHTRDDLIVTELTSTTLAKLDTDINPNSQGGLFSNMHIPHAAIDMPSSQNDPNTKIMETPALHRDFKHAHMTIYPRTM